MAEDDEKDTFFRNVIVSIKDLEEYPMLAGKNWNVVLAYLLKLLAIFTFVVVITFVYTTLKQINNVNEIGQSESVSQSINSRQQIQIIKDVVGKITESYSGTNQVFIYAVIFTYTYIYMYIIFFLSTALDIFLLSAFGYFTAIILRMHIKFKAMCKITIHGLTLPIILNAIYILIHTFIGFEIKYFDVMYIAVAYIYIITAILMIKSDFIKNQKELTRILQEQEKIRQELEKKKQQEDEEKQKQEKEEQKQKEKEQEKNENEDEDEDDGNLDNTEPQGDNA